jgi:hypothetical protein
MPTSGDRAPAQSSALANVDSESPAVAAEHAWLAFDATWACVICRSPSAPIT